MATVTDHDPRRYLPGDPERDFDAEAAARLRRLLDAPASTLSVSPWVERAREHTLPHKVHTDAPRTSESPSDVLRRTMPRLVASSGDGPSVADWDLWHPSAVGPDDSGMLTFGYSASYEDGQPREPREPAHDDDAEWTDLGGEG